MKSLSDTEEKKDLPELPLPIQKKTGRKRRVLRPLAPSTYLLRNLGKTVPLTAVIVLAVTLVTGIIAMIDSIPYSIRNVYRYAKEDIGITPRGDPSVLPTLVKDVEKNSPFKIGRVITCRVTGATVKSIVGKWPFIVLGLTQDDMRYYTARQLSHVDLGSIPCARQAGSPGQPAGREEPWTQARFRRTQARRYRQLLAGSG